MKISPTMQKLASQAKQAASLMALVSAEDKNHALHCIADELEKQSNSILKANQQDLSQATAKGMIPSLLDRLSLQTRLAGIIADIRQVARLNDPVGELLEEHDLPNGLHMKRVRVSLGVLGVIYEARPNVTCDVAALAIKTGNVAILRGGSETLNTNKVLVKAIQKGLEKSSLPKEAIQLIASPSRAYVKQLLKLDGFVDMIIPRGGEGLHRFCKEHSLIPVITGGMGVCHLYVEKSAKQDLSTEVIINAKTQRPSVCNALDTLLVDEAIADSFLPLAVKKLLEKGVTFRVDEKTAAAINPLMKQHSGAFQTASEQDWKTEWMSLVLGIKVVSGIEEALEHIRSCSTGHSDGILTESKEKADLFVRAVDSAAVYINASTRFTDGGEFGLGAEVAVSTQKLHARGPMGLEALTTYKWILSGNYQVRK